MKRRRLGKNLSIGGNNGLVAALHWHWSRTWRWALWCRKPHNKSFSAGRCRTYGGRGVRIWLRTPWFLLRFISQPNQPFRKCMEVRNDEDAED